MFEKMMDSYKTLIIIPIIITLLALACITINGLDQGVELKGGSQAVLQLNDNISSIDLQNQLSHDLGTSDVKVTNNGDNQVTVDLESSVNSTTFANAIKGEGKVISFNSIGPVLSEEAMGQIYVAMIFAFLFMAATVFIVFREFVPSIGVILAALCDIIIAVGGMSLFNIPLSIASVGALLMLIGYSVDTDILLTTRLLKRKEGTVVSRAKNAMETGLTMSFAAIAAMAILFIVTTIIMPEATTLSSIAGVLVIGLCGDIFTTWFMNLAILRRYIEWKHERKMRKYGIKQSDDDSSSEESKKETTPSQGKNKNNNQSNKNKNKKPKSSKKSNKRKNKKSKNKKGGK